MTTHNAKVSVIVPCHNVARYLSRCFECLLSQTIRDIEFICIDDKSTDSTLAKLQEYASQDARITVISHPVNMGVAATRNTGLANAHGEYIGFLDPDDTIDINFYNELYNLAIQSNADIAKGDVKTKYTPDTVSNVFSNTNINSVYDFSYGFWSAIYRREFLASHGIDFPVGVSMGEDLVFLYKAIFHATKFVKTNSVSYWYHIHPDSISNSGKKIPSDTINTLLTAYRNLIYWSQAQPSSNPTSPAYISNAAFNIIKHLCERTSSPTDYTHIVKTLIWLYENAPDKTLLHQQQNHQVIKALKAKDEKNLILFFSRRYKRLYLFGILPIVKITRYSDLQSNWHLFDFLPIFSTYRYENKTKIYLFKILILKIKGN